MYNYKTKNGKNGFIPGVGAIVNGLITSEVKLENPLLELVETSTSIVGTEVAQASVVTEATPISQPVPVTVPAVSTIAEASNAPIQVLQPQTPNTQEIK